MSCVLWQSHAALTGTKTVCACVCVRTEKGTKGGPSGSIHISAAKSIRRGGGGETLVTSPVLRDVVGEAVFKPLETQTLRPRPVSFGYGCCVPSRVVRCDHRTSGRSVSVPFCDQFVPVTVTVSPSIRRWTRET